MEQLPLISVIVPVYRVEQYLDACVGSILSQTYENLEVILVDDGSPDASGALCDAWAEKDSRVKVLHKENGGGGSARNAGLDIARGALIAFVDSDDYIAEDMFAYLYAIVEQGADIAECGYLTTEADGAEFPAGASPVQWYAPEEAMRCHIQDTAFQQLIWNKLYRREMVEGVRFPVGTKIDDEFFTYQALGNARRLARSERQCYAYRQQPGSVMHQNAPVKKLEGLRAKQQRLAYLEEKMPDLTAEAKVELMLSCVYAMQDWLRNPKGEPRTLALEEIRQIMAKLQPLDLSAADSAKQKLLLQAAARWPETAARMLNFLTDIHVLT